MSARVIETTVGEARRDKWGRPYVANPVSGVLGAYTRVSTVAKGLDDGGGLIGWKARMTAIGLSRRADLRAALSVTDAGDRKELDRIVELACQAAGAGDAAEMGTALHALCLRVDGGAGLGELEPEFQADVDAFHAALDRHGLELVEVERFVVIDALRVAGSRDAVVRNRVTGRLYVADLKTGASGWDAIKPLAVEQQVALYAHGLPYDPVKHARLDGLPVDLEKGVLIGLPAGSGEAKLYSLDLERGWDNVQLSMAVREARRDISQAPGWAAAE